MAPVASAGGEFDKLCHGCQNEITMKRKIIAFQCTESREENLSRNMETIARDGGAQAPILLFFCADSVHFHWYAKQLHLHYPDTTVIGAMTCEVMSSEGHSPHGLSILAIMSGITCAAGIVPDVRTYPMKHVEEVRKVFSSFAATENTVCFEITPCFSMCEELFLDTLAEASAGFDIPVFGSSSGTEQYEGASAVSLNGAVYQDAGIYVLIHNLNGRIFLYKETMYRPTDRVLQVTDVDCARRIIYEFDGKPALRAVADALEVSQERARELLFSHPQGRIDVDDIYITSPREILEDGAISYFAGVFNRTRMVILKRKQPELVMQKTCADIENADIHPDFMIVVNCGGRNRLLREIGKLDDVLATLREKMGPYFGISGFGEQLNFRNFNETMLLALFE